MFGARRSPDSSHQIDGGKKLRAFTNFMVLKKTPEKIPRSPEEPYFFKDMEENARDLLNLSRGRGLQIDKDVNFENVQRFRTPGDQNVSNSVPQNEKNLEEVVNSVFTENDDVIDHENGETSFDVINYGNQIKKPANQPVLSANPTYKEIVVTEPDSIPCWREFKTKNYKSFITDWHH